jgi:hypothetical protein
VWSRIRAGSPVQLLALLAGATFVLVGILGFVHAFHASTLLDVVHLVSGIVGIALARTPGTSGGFLAGAGLGYLGLWLLGVVGAGGWIPLDVTANWLHFALGLAALALAGASRRL